MLTIHHNVIETASTPDAARSPITLTGGIAMTPQSVVRLALADRGGWDELQRIPLPLVQLFLRVVLPLSLLPPAMVYYAGTYHGEEFMTGFGGKSWLTVAAAFLLAEWATVAGMGWVIKAIAAANGVRCEYRDAYLLAALSPIPLWLSSLTLFVPSFPLAVGVSMVALALSIGITYHGVRSLCRANEDVVAAFVAHGVVAVGLMAWALLLMLIIPV